MSSLQSEQINKLKQLATINRAMTTSLDSNEVLRQIAANACTLLGAKVSLVLLLNQDRSLLVCASSGCEEQTLADFAEPMEESIIDKLRVRLALKTEEALVAVPIMSGYEVNGMVVVGGAQLSGEEQWMLSALADQAAIALRNARLHEMEVEAAERERREARRALREIEDRYQLMIEEVKEYAIFMVDPAGQISTWNKGAERIFKYREDEILGQMAAIVYTAEDQAAKIPEKELITALTEGKAEDERWHLRKDGTRFWASGIVTSLKSASGELYGFVKMARDQTERKLVEEEREKLLASEKAARAEAEAANHLKDEFLATLSHELRSPLNSIVGYAQVLQRSPETTQFPLIQRAAETIYRNARAQAQLIDDLLDLSRLQTGKLSLVRRPVGLAPALGDAVESIRAQASEKEIKLDVDFTAEPLVVNADLVRVQQIVWNLVNNAVKFTPRGGRISVCLTRVGDEAHLVVEDSGQGIEPDFLPHVFEMFRQADARTTRNYGGLGIGLALVRQLVELHGGTVQADSAGSGQGARFTARLPLFSGANIEPIESGPIISSGALQGAQILVVDDTPDSLEMLRVLLMSEGAAVKTALTGERGIKLAQSVAFDLIISDISMPEMDGYEFLRKLRATFPRYAHIPAIALTGFGREEDVARSQQAGFTTHLTKPLDFDHLVRLARVTLRQ